MIKKISNFAVIFLVFLLFFGCATRDLGRNSLLEFEIEQTSDNLPEIKNEQHFSGDELLKRRFKVFDMSGQNLDINTLSWAFSAYSPSKNKKYFSFNHRLIKKSWFSAQKQNANFDKIGSVSRFAVSIDNTALRNFPTDEPIFLDPDRAGEGYPFDYLQASALSIGYPLFVSHLSKDGAWALVSDDSIWAWVKAKDIKFLNKSQAKSYKKQKFLVIKNDKTPVYDLNGRFLFYAKIGALIGYLREDEYKFYGQIYTHLGLSDFEISKQNASKFPLKLNEKNIKKLAGSLLSQPYGWGGMGGFRDCSLFLKDFLASFGLWLPRNSLAQANIGQKINLKGLSNEKKLEIIREKGVPYKTLIHLPGHIMLYTGVKNDEIYVLHSNWGLKSANKGRAIIGGVALTTLKIGQNRGDINDSDLLISRADSMNVLSNLTPKKDDEILAKKIANFERAYSVKIVNNRVKFGDGSEIKFDDGLKKDEACENSKADTEDMIAPSYALLAPLNAPLSDAGRCRDYALLSKIYGKNLKDVKKNLIDVIWLKDSLNLKLKFNRQNGAAQALKRVSDELNELVKKEPKMLEFLKDPGGTFKWRKIAGTNRLSPHSYAIAIDINVKNSHYWRWVKKYKNLIPREIVEIFEKNGFIWGGRWRHFDTMHFEYRPEFKD